MKHEIVRRQFAKVDGTWVDVDDMARRGLDVERSWSSFSALVHTDKPQETAAVLRKQIVTSQVDVVPSPAAGGVWIVGAYYQLEKILPALTAG